MLNFARYLYEVSYANDQHKQIFMLLFLFCVLLAYTLFKDNLLGSVITGINMIESIK